MYNCNFSAFVIECLLIKGYLLTYLLFFYLYKGPACSQGEVSMGSVAPVLLNTFYK